jgi:hypothetical protein
MRNSSMIAALLLTLVTACGGGGDASSDDTPTPPAENDIVSGSGTPARTPTLGIEIRQASRAVVAPAAGKDKANGRSVVELRMKAGGFQMRLPRQKEGVAVQITAWTDRSIFDVTDGAPVKTHPSFGDATGVADGEGGSGTLFLNAQGNNYLVGEQLFAHSDTTDEVTFFQTQDGAKVTHLAEQHGDVYLAVFIDKNKNGIFDAGEVEYLVLHY